MAKAERHNGLAFATLLVVAMGGLASTLHGNARTAVLVILVIAAVVGAFGWLRPDIVVRNVWHRGHRKWWDGKKSRWLIATPQISVASKTSLKFVLYPPAHLARREAMHPGSLLAGASVKCAVFNGTKKIAETADIKPSSDGAFIAEDFYPAPLPPFTKGRYRVWWTSDDTYFVDCSRRFRINDDGRLTIPFWRRGATSVRLGFRRFWTGVIDLIQEDESR